MDAYDVQVKHLDKARISKVRALETALGCTVIALEAKPRLAELTPDQTRRLQDFENELCIALVAYEPEERLRPAILTDDQHKRLREVEQELGLALVAHELIKPLPYVQSYTPSQELELVNLSEEQFAQLKATEDEVGVMLMAYRKRTK